MNDLNRLAGLRILIAEDDYLAANELANLLSQAGATVVGPCPDGPATMQHILNSQFDCAVIDLDLGLGVNFVIASALYEARIPTTYVSGHGRSRIPSHLLENANFFAKPIDYRGLIGAIASRQRLLVN